MNENLQRGGSAESFFMCGIRKGLSLLEGLSEMLEKKAAGISPGEIRRDQREASFRVERNHRVIGQ